MVSLVQISYIIDLSITRSFSKSAKRCFVSQPTLSMQVKKAEETLGATIFNRDGKVLELTPFGIEFVEKAKNVQEEFSLLKEFVNHKSDIIIDLSIGVIPTMSSFILPFIQGYAKEMQGKVKIHLKELSTEDLILKLEDGQIDAGFMAGSEKYNRFEQKSFALEPLIPYVNEDNIKKGIKVEDLYKVHPWLLSSNNCLSLQMLKLCQIDILNENLLSYDGGNMQLLVDLVNSEGGYTLIPFFMLDKLQIAESHECYFKDSTPVRNLVIIYKKRSSNKKLLEALVEKAKDEFKVALTEKTVLIDWNS
jgi:LysR family hydrogen peroxide-inducible transcriptional activator